MEMASVIAWSCQLCAASYRCLFDLVGHVRAAHSADVNLSYVCQVQGCLRTFKKTNTWYKHVLQVHHEKYYSRDCNEESGSCEYLEADISDLSEVQGDESLSDSELRGACTANLQVSSSSPESSVSLLQEDVIAGKLLSIREKHHLSHAAIDEVVELIVIVCNQMSTEALSLIQQSAIEAEMDTTSHFFQELPNIFESLSSPLAFVNATYKQQSFVDKNLPYVVSRK